MHVVTTLAAVLALGVLGVALPRLYAWRLSAVPIATGALREAIDGLAARLGVSLRDVLLWTGSPGRPPSALSVGLTRRSTIFLNDQLVRSLSPRGVAAVCAHELAHARHRHSLFYLAFLLGSLFSVASLGQALHGSSEWVSALAVVFCLLVALGFVLPFVARRFDVEADLLGAEVSGWTEYRQTVRDLCERLPAWGSRSGWWHRSLEERSFLLDKLAASAACRRRLRWWCLVLRLGILTWLASAAFVFGVFAVRDSL